MIGTNISMPHPVLGVPGDMTGGFNVLFKIKIDRETRSYVFHDVQVVITNPYIESLYNKNVLNLLIKICCVPAYGSWLFRGTKSFSIPEHEIDLMIEVESYLTAAEQLDDYHNESFNKLFGDKVFKLEKDDIVGVTGLSKIPINKENERTSLGSIFRFARINKNSPTQEMHFSFDEDQIVINYPSGDDDFNPITFLFDAKLGVPLTALSLYVIPALTEAFRAIEDDETGSLQGYRWYTALSSWVPDHERTEEPFINAQKAVKAGLPITLAVKELMSVKNMLQ